MPTLRVQEWQKWAKFPFLKDWKDVGTPSHTTQTSRICRQKADTSSDMTLVGDQIRGQFKPKSSVSLIWLFINFRNWTSMTFQEEDKARLVQETGLQLKQINNWFINQRKRNWHSNPSTSTVLKSKRKRYFYCFIKAYIFI
jgi:hypothetical protein